MLCLQTAVVLTNATDFKAVFKLLDRHAQIQTDTSIMSAGKLSLAFRLETSTPLSKHYKTPTS